MQHIITAEGEHYKDVPRWIKSAIYDDEIDIIFVPAEITGNENLALFNAVFDGIAVTHLDDHLYLPVEWVKNEMIDFPEAIKLCNKIISIVKKECSK